METESDRFDFSTYPRTHFCFSNKNKKVIGKMKDENNGVAQLEFVGLKSKMYSITDGKHEKKTAKGVNRNVTERELKHADYRNCLFDETSLFTSMNRIQSKGHQLYTVHMRKKSLCAFDDKRYILNDGINTLAYGHYKIQSLK